MPDSIFSPRDAVSGHPPNHARQPCSFRLIFIISEYSQIKLICYFGRESKWLSCSNWPFFVFFFFFQVPEANHTAHLSFGRKRVQEAGESGVRVLCPDVPSLLPTSCLWGQCIDVPAGLAKVRLQQRGCSCLVFFCLCPTVLLFVSRRSPHDESLAKGYPPQAPLLGNLPKMAS